MEIEERLSMLFRACRYGRLPVYQIENGEKYILHYVDLLNMSLRSILYGIQENKFKYDGKII